MQRKPNGFLGEVKTIFQELQKRPATAAMVSKATGVPQKNLCRYKRDLEKAGRLREIKKDVCEVTGCKAWYLTTDPTLFPDNQLKMFE